jgi:hypothetical protein
VLVNIYNNSHQLYGSSRIVCHSVHRDTQCCFSNCSHACRLLMHPACTCRCTGAMLCTAIHAVVPHFLLYCHHMLLQCCTASPEMILPCTPVLPSAVITCRCTATFPCTATPMLLYCCTAVLPHLERHRRPTRHCRLRPALYVIVDVVHSDRGVLWVCNGDLTVHGTLVHCVRACLLDIEGPGGILQRVETRTHEHW